MTKINATSVSTLTKKQEQVWTKLGIDYCGEKADIIATVRYDDRCGNGHNTFSITADIYKAGRRSDSAWMAGGCCHDDIAKHFPKLAPFIKWHLTSANGPLHYVANTVYHAGDHDCWGMLKGEKRQLRNGKTGVPYWKRVVRDEQGNEINMGVWSNEQSSETQPVENLTVTWEPVWRVGEGKERDLDAARHTAVWLDATDEELTAPGLKERLIARLPGLLAEFRAAVESLGFIW